MVLGRVLLELDLGAIQSNLDRSVGARAICWADRCHLSRNQRSRACMEEQALGQHRTLQQSATSMVQMGTYRIPWRHTTWHTCCHRNTCLPKLRRASARWGLTIRSTGHFAAHRLWASFHFRPMPVCRKMPVSSNVRHRKFSTAALPAPMNRPACARLEYTRTACGRVHSQLTFFAGAAQYGKST